MKIEPVTKMRRAIERKKQVELLGFANRKKREKDIQMLGIMKGKVKIK